MKKILGFIMFWIGVGIFITLFFPKDSLFLRIFFSSVFILCGYLCFSGC